MTPTQDDRGPTTTSGHIAVANLNAQVIGLTAQLDRTRSAQGGTALLTATGAAPLVDVPIDLGTHQLVVRHPTAGEERRTIAATSAPVRVQIDFGNQN